MATQKAVVQAQSDLFKSSATGLNQNSTKKLVLAVLANDLGGPKTLFSLDKRPDAAGATSSTPRSLLTQDTARSESTSKDTSLNGAKIWINADGTVGYDASTLSASFRAELQKLSAGQTKTDSFVYAIRLSDGTLSWGTAKVEFAGTNDRATITTSVKEDTAVVEAGGVANGTPGDPTASGKLTVNDIDTGQSNFKAPSAASLQGTYGTFTFNASTGQWTYTLDNSRAATQRLAQGVKVHETLTVTSADGTATKTIDVTVTGTNDRATITTSVKEDTAVVEAGGVANGTPGDPIASGKLTVNDVDTGQNNFKAPSAASLQGTYGTFTFNATGQWTYTLDNSRAASQRLAQGVKVRETLTVTSADGTATKTIDVTVTGSNDAATITASVKEDTAVVEAGGVANGTPGDPTASGKLTVNDVDTGQNNFKAPTATSLHGTYGTLTFDASNGQWTYTLDNSRGTTQGLAQGVKVHETLTVTSADGTATKTIDVTVSGSNDAATITASVNGDSAVIEAGGIADGAAGDLTASGKLTVHDVDTGQDLFKTPPAASLEGTYGTFIFDASSGQWRYTLDISRAATQGLAQGAEVHETLTVSSADGTATETIHVTVVTPTNHAPTAIDDIAGTDEDGSLAGSVAYNDGDLDDGETATLSYALDGSVAGLTLNPDGSYSFDAADAAYQHLAAGDSELVVASYTVTDAQGATSSASLSITVTGTNDAPVAVANSAAVAEDGSVNASVALNDGDPDDGETATLSYALDAPVAGLTLNPDGSYSFNAADAAYQHLAAGDSELVGASYTVTDVQGATGIASLSITVTGTNDAPTAVADAAAVDEDGIINGSLAANDGDADDGETATLSYALNAPVAGLILDADGSISFEATDAAYQHLAAGDSELVVASYTVTDAQGATSTASLSVTVTGTNDAPVAVDDSAAVNEDGIVTGSVAANDSDLDDGETATLSYALDAPVAGLTLNPDGSYSFDANDAAYQHLAAGGSELVVASYTVTDAQGDTGSASLSIIVTGTNDAPTAVADAAAVDEDGIINGSLAANDGDADDGDTATLSYALNAPVAGLILDADGSISFEATDAAYQHLAAGESELVVASYTVTDAQGATSTASLSVTVTGTNDAPVAVDDSAAVNEDGSIIGSVATNDSDPDAGEAATLSYALEAPVPGLILNPDGSYSFDAADPAYQHLTAGNTEFVLASYTVTDAQGATSNASLSITITGTNDAPTAVADIAAVDAGGDVTGSVAPNDSDLDDDEAMTLSYALDAPVAGLTLNPDGSYSFEAAAYQHLAAGDTELVVASYTVTDAQSATSTASLSITVTGTNESPSAVAESAAVDEDGSIIGSVATNDSDPDAGEAATLSYALEAPVPGLILNPDGSYSFDATDAAYQHLAAGGTELVVASYTVTDAQGDTSSASLSIIVTGINDAPTAVADSAAVDEDGIVTGSVAANDGDLDAGEAETLSYELDAPVAGLTLNPSGSYSFDAADAAYQQLAAGDTELVVASYTVTDAQGATGTASLSIAVTGTNDAPVASITPTAYAATEQVALNLKGTGLSVADVDVASSSVTVTLSASEGALNVAAGTSGAVVSGSGSGSVTLTGTLAQINALLATDGTSTVSYIDNTDTSSATATLTLVVNDNAGNGAALTGSDTATINIAAINDAPVATITPTAYAATEQVAVNLKGTGLSVADVDAASNSVTVTLSVSEGTLNVAAGTSGAVVSGSGSASVTLTGTLAQINALLATDGTSTVSYIDNTDTPSASTTLTLAINDNGSSGVGGPLTAHDTATINITAVNDGPTANADNVITNVGTSLVIPEWALLNNDVDTDGGSTPDVSGVSSPSGLTATHAAGTGTNGTITVNDLTPAGGTFNYSATDGTTVGPVGTVTVSQDTSGTLDGTAGNDILVGSNSAATLVGGDGNDVQLGGSGSDTYRSDLSDGSDIIRDAGGSSDSISIVTTGATDSTAIGVLNFERVGSDLIIDVGPTHITVKDHYAGSAVEDISFTNGGTVYGGALSTSSYSLSTDASGTLSGTAGRDVIASSSAGEALSGSNGNDLLFGNGGNDNSIDGGIGNDLIVGGLGNDTLTGGSGDDIFVFNTTLNATANVDTISDFNASAADKISLDHLIFSGISSGGALVAADFAAVSSGTTSLAAATANIIFDTTAKTLYYDADGADTLSGRILFASLSGVNAATLDNTDFLTF